MKSKEIAQGEMSSAQFVFDSLGGKLFKSKRVRNRGRWRLLVTCTLRPVCHMRKRSR